jgi:hypothetical protein
MKRKLREYNFQALQYLALLNIENRLKWRKTFKDGIKITKYFGYPFKFKKRVEGNYYGQKGNIGKVYSRNKKKE